MKKYSKIRVLTLTGSVVLAGGMLTACSSTATPTASCTYVVGDGSSGHDAKIHEIAWPGQNVNIGSGEVAQYVACGPRNFIINPTGQRDASGHVIGDSHTPLVGYTKDHTKVRFYVTAYWTLNQTKTALNEFYPFCYKYTCYGTDSSEGTKGGSNFGTGGWNGMLGENFGPALNDLARQELPKFDDSIWKNHDVTQWNTLGKKMSDHFAEAIRPMTGVPDDLFCGSGNSGWSDPNKPGEGKFTCSQVRFKVTDLDAADAKLQNQQEKESSAEKQQTVNEKELAAAKARYGDSASYWLGLQDTLKECKQGNSCVVVIGGNGSNMPGVSIPQPTPSHTAKK